MGIKLLGEGFGSLSFVIPNADEFCFWVLSEAGDKRWGMDVGGRDQSNSDRHGFSMAQR